MQECCHTRHKPSRTRGNKPGTAEVEATRGAASAPQHSSGKDSASTGSPRRRRRGSRQPPWGGSGIPVGCCKATGTQQPPPACPGGVCHPRQSSFTCNGKNYISQSCRGSRSRCRPREDPDPPRTATAPRGPEQWDQLPSCSEEEVEMLRARPCSTLRSVSPLMGLSGARAPSNPPPTNWQRCLGLWGQPSPWQELVASGPSPGPRWQWSCVCQSEESDTWK